MLIVDAVRETAIAIVAVVSSGIMSVAVVVFVVIVGGGCSCCCCGVGGVAADVGGKQWQPVASCATSLQIPHLKPLVRVIDEDPILGNFTALRHWRRC